MPEEHAHTAPGTGAVPYGFDDDAETRRLLRSRPLRGGTASAVHELTVVTPEGGTRRAVLRRYVRPELNLEEPDMADYEARALRFVAHLDVPTPELLAADTSGDDAGVPAVLMS